MTLASQEEANQLMFSLAKLFEETKTFTWRRIRDFLIFKTILTQAKMFERG